VKTFADVFVFAAAVGYWGTASAQDVARQALAVVVLHGRLTSPS
jgi:hypothetical protein